MKEVKELAIEFSKLMYHVLILIGLVAFLVYLIKDIGGMLCQ